MLPDSEPTQRKTAGLFAGADQEMSRRYHQAFLLFSKREIDFETQKWE